MDLCTSSSGFGPLFVPSSLMNALRFSNIYFLSALAVIPLLILLFYFVTRWKKRTIEKIGDPKLVRLLIADYSPSAFLIKFVLLLLTITF
ncbi:MAG TPA: hypothetical protein VLC28_09865, partial [Flavitalea sp.]|nr:hypothetical protein [Flavitalea sp.]